MGMPYYQHTPYAAAYKPITYAAAYKPVSHYKPMHMQAKTYSNDAMKPMGYAGKGLYHAESAGAVHIAKREAEAEPAHFYSAMPYYQHTPRLAVKRSSCHHVAIRSHHEDGPRAAARREISLHPARETGGIRRLHDEECNGQGPPHRVHLRAIHDRHVRRHRVAALHGQNDRLLHESALQVGLHGDAA